MIRRHVFGLVALMLVALALPACDTGPEPEFNDPAKRLEYRVGKKLVGKKLTSFAVRKTPGAWTVDVEYDAGEAFTISTQKLSIERAIINSLHVIFTSGDPVERATVKAFMPLVDQHGQEFQARVFQVTMRRGLAAKINWENRHALDLHRLGIVEFMNPEFKGV